MFRCLLLSDSLRHSIEFPARRFELFLGPLLLTAVHLRHGRGEPPASAMQDRNRHLQIALDLPGYRWPGCRRLPLRFEKQFRFGENALANQA
jgi:hypothetical protein